MQFYPKHAPAEAHKDDRGFNADLADHHLYETPFHLIFDHDGDHDVNDDDDDDVW